MRKLKKVLSIITIIGALNSSEYILERVYAEEINKENVENIGSLEELLNHVKDYEKTVIIPRWKDGYENKLKVIEDYMRRGRYEIVKNKIMVLSIELSKESDPILDDIKQKVSRYNQEIEVEIKSVGGLKYFMTNQQTIHILHMHTAKIENMHDSPDVSYTGGKSEGDVHYVIVDVGANSKEEAKKFIGKRTVWIGHGKILKGKVVSTDGYWGNAIVELENGFSKHVKDDKSGQDWYWEHWRYKTEEEK